MTEQSFSLSELNSKVKFAIEEYLPGSYWLRAETSDVRRNRNGHCYLEFIEKDSITQSIIAKARGMIWSNVFEMLSEYFLKETGQEFTSGLSVLVRVNVSFHELYGYSLTVNDIDPSFTLGEIARNRQLVLNRLEEEGVLTLNKELQMPELANRIAVISSPTAAGYEDFKHQLAANPNGFTFYPKLFPAIMQGDRAESSIISALERVFLYRNLFDAVAIIRGGGASADLNCFDSYLLATNVAQFPLPVVSGIGHERDVTVIDFVSHTRAKTPTAVAEFFITHMGKTAIELIDLKDRVVKESSNRVIKERTQIDSFSKDLIHKSKMRLQKESNWAEKSFSEIKNQINQFLQRQQFYIEGKEQFIKLVSPDNILKRGYTLTLKNGKIMTSINDLAVGDEIQTLFRDGSSISKIEKANKL